MLHTDQDKNGWIYPIKYASLIILLPLNIYLRPNCGIMVILDNWWMLSPWTSHMYNLQVLWHARGANQGIIKMKDMGWHVGWQPGTGLYLLTWLMLAAQAIVLSMFTHMLSYIKPHVVWSIIHAKFIHSVWKTNSVCIHGCTCQS